MSNDEKCKIMEAFGRAITIKHSSLVEYIPLWRIAVVT